MSDMEQKLCRVRTVGLLEQDGEKETIETFSDGFIRKKGTEVTIVYKEVSEEPGLTETNVRMVFTETADGPARYECRMTKKGLVESEMLFMKDAESECIYRMPFGEIRFDLFTKDVTFDFTSTNARGHLIYLLLVDGEVITSADVQIEASFDE